MDSPDYGWLEGKGGRRSPAPRQPARDRRSVLPPPSPRAHRLRRRAVGHMPTRAYNLPAPRPCRLALGPGAARSEVVPPKRQLRRSQPTTSAHSPECQPMILYNSPMIPGSSKASQHAYTGYSGTSSARIRERPNNGFCMALPTSRGALTSSKLASFAVL